MSKATGEHFANAESLLFLSCDLVGSTHHKQKLATRWQITFLVFYRGFPQALAQVAQEQGCPLTFTLWKAFGDELVFTCHVRHEQDVTRAVYVWLAAMARYEADTLQDEDMRTKGGAFIATFPGPDSRVSIPLNPLTEISDKGVVELNDDAIAFFDPSRYLYDYLGPSFDTGFRVVSECGPRYFTMSVEAAWAYGQGTRFVAEPGMPELKYLGERKLKGVWNGRPYPLIGLDRSRTNPVDRVNEALTLLGRSLGDPASIDSLCEACAGTEGWPTAIYLPDSKYPQFRHRPEDSLAGLRTNAMDGAETLPPKERETRLAILRKNAPLA